MFLEDEFFDVIAKAMRGLGLGAKELAVMAGISEGELFRLLEGEMDGGNVRKISPFLGLDAEALIALPGYLPQPIGGTSGVTRLELPFGEWSVNAWLVQVGGICLLFDTGFGAQDILAKTNSDKIDAVFITHEHPDHVGGRKALGKAGLQIVSEKEAILRGVVEYGSGISVQAIDLSGHKDPAVGYLVRGMEVPLFVVGDALFAGSMGGCGGRGAYELAFRNLRAALYGLEDNCILLPGHGPATTVGQERISNPFSPGFK